MLRFAPSALFTAFTLLAVPALAADEPETTWFENDVLHFAAPDDVFITTTSVIGPQGPVDVITVRPRDTVSGEVSGPSFIAITVFRAPLPGTGDQAELAEDHIVRGVTAALDGAEVTESARRITLAGTSVQARQLALSLDGESASATVGAVTHDGSTFVYYDQRHRSDVEAYPTLDQIGPSLAWGAVPEPVEDASDDDHGDDDHGDDHGGEGHDDHGH